MHVIYSHMTVNTSDDETNQHYQEGDLGAGGV